MGDTNAQPIGDKPSKCIPANRSAFPQKLPPLLGEPAIHRGDHMIVDFNLDHVAPNPTATGRGGITTDDRALTSVLGNCADSPSGDSAELKNRATDEKSRLTVEIVGISAVGRSGRGWPGVHCHYRLADISEPSLYAELGADTIPPINELNGVVRVDNIIYGAVQFNGYAKDIEGKGNLVVAFDLCSHERLWKSDYLTSNAAVLVHGNYLVTGYGFTAEKRFLYVLNRWTGQVVQKIPLSKSPDELRIHENKLFVRLYDGYAVFPLHGVAN